MHSNAITDGDGKGWIGLGLDCLGGPDADGASCKYVFYRTWNEKAFELPNTDLTSILSIQNPPFLFTCELV